MEKTLFRLFALGEKKRLLFPSGKEGKGTLASSRFNWSGKRDVERKRKNRIALDPTPGREVGLSYHLFRRGMRSSEEREKEKGGDLALG